MNKHETRIAYRNFLENWNWELHATLTFRRPMPLNKAFKHAKCWLHEIKHKCPNIRFAAVMIASKTPHGIYPHVHVLMISDPNYPRTLMDVSRFRLRYYWTSQCKITSRKEWSNRTIANYVSKPKNISLPDPDAWDIDYYRPELLKRLRHTSTTF